MTVVAKAENSGPVETFNLGLAQATGEFLVRLDADDMLTPGSIARAVAVMQAMPRVGLVYGHPIHFTGDDLPPARTDADRWLIWAGVEWLAARCADGTNVITSPEAVMRRSVVDVVGGQRPLAHTHDMEMWLRIAAHCDAAYIVGADQAWHREHAMSLSKADHDPFLIPTEIRAAFDVLFAGFGELTDDQRTMYAQARRAVALGALEHAASLADRGSSADVCLGLQQFAVETYPAVRSTRQWRRVVRAADLRRRSGALAQARGVLPRARRRLRTELRDRRWSRTGVYERLEVLPA